MLGIWENIKQSILCRYIAVKTDVQKKKSIYIFKYGTFL